MEPAGKVKPHRQGSLVSSVASSRPEPHSHAAVRTRVSGSKAGTCTAAKRSRQRGIIEYQIPADGTARRVDRLAQQPPTSRKLIEAADRPSHVPSRAFCLLSGSEPPICSADPPVTTAIDAVRRDRYTRQRIRSCARSSRSHLGNAGQFTWRTLDIDFPATGEARLADCPRRPAGGG